MVVTLDLVAFLAGVPSRGHEIDCKMPPNYSQIVSAFDVMLFRAVAAATPDNTLGCRAGENTRSAHLSSREGRSIPRLRERDSRAHESWLVRYHDFRTCPSLRWHTRFSSPARYSVLPGRGERWLRGSRLCRSSRPSNQSMKANVPLRNTLRVIATPCRSLSPSR